MWNVIYIILVFNCALCRSQFFNCHDDPAFEPDEGTLSDLQFTWLGALQYIHDCDSVTSTSSFDAISLSVKRSPDKHTELVGYRSRRGLKDKRPSYRSIRMHRCSNPAVKNGTPHYFRVPRVVLISRQFALSTAVDAAQIPDGYALGNVVFGNYERDEKECHLTIDQLADGAECEPAILLMPIADVLLHPEYKHFGVRSSIALLKLVTPVKSDYMLPACLPFKDFVINRVGKQTTEKLYHVDFASDVPRDFLEEDKEVTKVMLLPRELCFLYDSPENATTKAKERLACTTGCGFHSGAATLVHEHTGHWSIIAISQGGSPCPDPLRTRRPPPPPLHILLHPYVPWITSAITGKAVGSFSKDDPFGFVMPRASLYDKIGHTWNGHWWMGGLRCFDRGEAANDIFKFYHEIFQLKPSTKTYMTYTLEIDAAYDTMIICVKVGMPFRIGQPKVWELDSPATKVRIPLLTFQHLYKFQVEAWAYNATGDSSSEYSESSTSSEGK